MLLGLFVHEVLFAWTQEEWKARKTLPCSQVSSLSPPSPSGMFCMNILSACFRLSRYFLAPYTVSLAVIYTITNSFWEITSWGREAATAEFQGIFCINPNEQCWVCQLSTSVPMSPCCNACLYWDGCCSLFLPFASRTALQSLFSPKQGDFHCGENSSSDLGYGPVSGRLVLFD